MTDIRSTTAGVVLAAGRGRRMGTLKQLLAWGDSTVIASAFDGIVDACGAGMIVVVGARADDVLAALEPRVFRAVTSDPDAEQLDSIRAGVQAALEEDHVTHVLLHPADHPRVPAPVLERVVARASASDRVVIPTHEGRGGHPVMLPAPVAREVMTAEISGGLRAYWETRPEIVQRIECDAAEIVVDLDTPEDYRRARPEPR